MNPDKTFILAHLSDPHMAYPGGSRLTDFFNKRFFGYVKWRLKRQAEHQQHVLDAMIQDVCDCHPDHVVVTGDLTHMGLPAEYDRAKEFLRDLGPPSEVTIIPGNHDAYVDGALDCRMVDWAEYMVSDGETVCDGSQSTVNAIFPSLRVRDGVGLIGVSTAQPCSTFLAVGCVGHDQLQRLQEILVATGQKQLFRVVLVHHPPKSGVVSWRKRLTDADAFQKVLHACGAELILHGHAHHSSRTYLDASGSQIPVIGVPSASSVGKDTERRARYHLYHLSSRTDGWDMRICVRVFNMKTRRFDTEYEYRLTN
jgi:3',5'-cyclic AMP phosphodiesterase CpdA